MSRRAKMMIARWTLLGTLGCLVISLLYNYLAFRNFPRDALVQGMISAFVLPVLLAGPLFFYLTIKLRELAVVNHKLGVLASTDGLTGVWNRRAFASAVEAAIAPPSSGERRMGPRGALILIDIDHFKRINDTFGHDAGDAALCQIVAVVRDVIRDTDLLGRLGGEEFAIYLHDVDGARATCIAERIRAALAERTFLPHGQPHRLSASFGVAAFDGPTSFSQLFKTADQRLYEAKAMGRNRVVAGDPVASPQPGGSNIIRLG